MSNLLGYLLATVPQLVVDPKLTSHVRFGAREYPYGWWVLLIASAVAAWSWHLAGGCEKGASLGKCCFHGVLPLVVGALASIPIFAPEMPHMNLMFVSFSWTVLTVAGIGLRMLPSWLLDGISASGREDAASREYVRECAILVRNILAGTVVAYFGFVITALKTLHHASTQIVSSKADMFLLVAYEDLAVLLLSAFFFFHVVFPGLGALREILRAMVD